MADVAEMLRMARLARPLLREALRAANGAQGNTAARHAADEAIQAQTERAHAAGEAELATARDEAGRTAARRRFSDAADAAYLAFRVVCRRYP